MKKYVHAEDIIKVLGNNQFGCWMQADLMKDRINEIRLALKDNKLSFEDRRKLRRERIRLMKRRMECMLKMSQIGKIAEDLNNIA